MPPPASVTSHVPFLSPIKSLIPSISRKLLLSLCIFHPVNLFNDLLCLSDPCWGPNSWGGPPAAHRHKFPLSSHVTVAPCQQKNRLQGTSGGTRGDIELWSRWMTHRSDWEIWFHYKNQRSLLVERLISFQLWQTSEQLKDQWSEYYCKYCKRRKKKKRRRRREAPLLFTMACIDGLQHEQTAFSI